MKFHSEVDDVLNDSRLISQVFVAETRAIERHSFSQESYSQESAMDSIKSTLKMYYSDLFWIIKMFDDGAKKASNEASDLLVQIRSFKNKDTNDSKEVSIAGAIHLNGVNSASELINKLQKYNDTVLGAKGAKSVTSVSDGLANITEIIRSAWFATDDAQDARLNEIRSEALRSFKEVASLNAKVSGGIWNVTHGLGASASALSFNDDGEAKIQNEHVSTDSNDSLSALSQTEKDKLIAILEKMLSKGDIESSINNMARRMQTLYGYTWVNDKLRFSGLIGKILFGVFSIAHNLFANTSDLKRAMSFTTLAEVTKEFWLKELAERNKVAKAALSYLQASCN